MVWRSAPENRKDGQLPRVSDSGLLLTRKTDFCKRLEEFFHQIGPKDGLQTGLRSRNPNNP